MLRKRGANGERKKERQEGEGKKDHRPDSSLFVFPLPSTGYNITREDRKKWGEDIKYIQNKSARE